jgi:ferritin
MFNEKIQDAFNKQLNAEMHSSYLYLSMAAWFETQNLPGMASWMRAQTVEENQHAMKFFDYVNERGGCIKLKEIDGPKTEWDSPRAVFEDSLKHERKITGMINDLMELCIKERDFAAQAFLQWFATEQVEEEATVDNIVEQFKMIGDQKGMLFMLDRELGRRPAPGAAPQHG